MALRNYMVAAVLAAASAWTAGAATIADSVADYTNVQGNNGWYYGYRSGSFNAASFTDMSSFQCGAEIVWATHSCPQNAPWTGIGASWNVPGLDMSANGANSGTVEWVDRRWVSSFAGTAYITGEAQHNPNLLLSSADMYIDVFVDDLEVFHQLLGGTDATGFPINLAVTVSVGSKVDFVAEPSNPDWDDHVLYSAQIADSTAPEPATFWLVSTVLAAVGTWRLARRRGESPV